MILKAIFLKIKVLPKIFLIPLLVAVGILIFFLIRTQQPQKLEFTQVKKSDIREEVIASGTLNGKNTVNLKFLKSGKLASINVKQGGEIFAGQTIAGLDPQDLSITLQQAQNNLKDKQTSVDKILDDIHLYQYGNGGWGNIGSASETMTQRQIRTSAEVARDNAFDAVKSAQRSFQDVFISSPVTGIVTQISILPGQFISPADLIAQVVDNSQIFFDSDVDETDLNKISVGQDVEITLDAYPDKTFTGRLEQILPQTKTTSTGATTLTARISITPPEDFVFGITGQASIIINEAKNVLIIPLEALGEDGSVVIQTPRGFKAVQVELGLRSDADVEIKSGLQEGDRVVLNPPNFLGK